MLTALFLATMLLPGVALAQTKKATTAPAAAPSLSSIITQLDSFLEQLSAKSISDLEAADALAAQTDPTTNQPVDALAHACYPALIKFVQSLPAPPSGQVGPAVIYERTRILRMTVQNGLPNYLKIGCAPLVQDESTLLVKIAALLGVTLTLPIGL